MAKIIKNVDKIITTSGTEVDLDNIQASGGGASVGGSVSAEGLALTRSEGSATIDYSFNVGYINTQEADGHSTSATEMMMVGGHTGGTSMHTYIDKISFSDNSATNNFGTLSYSTTNQSAGSDGATVMTCGGGAGSTYLGTCAKISFQDGSETSWGELRNNLNALGSGASDGDKLAVNGGYAGSGWYKNYCDLKSFAEDTTSVDHGNLTIGGRDNDGGVGYTGDCSDGTSFILMCSYGGMKGTQKKAFADGSTDEAWTDMIHSEWGGRPASDKTHAVLCGGSGMGYTTYGIQKILFADKSAAESWGSMQQNRAGASVSSDGNGKIIIAKGNASSTYYDSSEYKAFDNNSTTEVASSLSNTSSGHSEGSGS